jgi:D-alanyl-lipoteichoic acid acyltransferase DltB (MBOAT superfamily)
VLFHSLEYAVFLPLSALAYHLAPARHRWAVLVATGLLFLALVSPVHAAVALGLLAFNHATGLGIERWADTPRGVRVLWLALLVDVGVLGYFKYQGFFRENVNGLVGLAGIAPPFTVRALLLPLGISYYTFQLIGYNLEIHWGRETAEPHFGRFAASVLFFPKLIAGPIERPHRFLAQLGEGKPLRAEAVSSGLVQIGWGLFKKCVIADRVALVVDLVWQTPRAHQGWPLLVGIFAYVVQVYNDFSGYTDIALGSARLFGIELSPNFNHPFSARSVTDFWRRWHISLSSWTNDYIYKPLSMYISLETEWGKGGLVLSILVTFFVLGFWHGASWTFIAFGLVQGAAVSFEFLTQRARGAALGRLPARVADGLRHAATLGFYGLSCVFFRARTVGDALHVLTHAPRALGDLRALRLFAPLAYHLGVLAVFAAAFGLWRLRARPLPEAPTWARWSLYYAVVVSVLVCGLFEVNQFVYVQF